MDQFWCFSALLLWTGVSSMQRSSDEFYPFTFCFKSEPAWTFSSICTIFWTADWSGGFSHSKWISRCDKATFFYFLHQGWFFQNFALWTNAWTNHNDCAERMSHLSPRTTTTMPYEFITCFLSAPSFVWQTRCNLYRMNCPTSVPNGTGRGTGSALLWGGETLLCYPYFVGGRGCTQNSPLCWRAWWGQDLHHCRLRSRGQNLFGVCWQISIVNLFPCVSVSDLRGTFCTFVLFICQTSVV